MSKEKKDNAKAEKNKKDGFVFSGEVLRIFLRYYNIKIYVVAEEAGRSIPAIRRLLYLDVVPYNYRLVMNRVFHAVNWLDDKY